MRNLVRTIGPVLAIGLIFGVGAGTGAAAGSSVPDAAVSQSAPSTVGTGPSSLGTVLVGPTGLTLHTHAGDTSTVSTCTGGCATAWPPLTLASGDQPTAGSGVTGHLGTLIRSDGATQVSYNGQPLYNFAGDAKPSDVTGNGVAGFSVAKPGTVPALPATSIAGSIRAGTSLTGTFLSGRTLVLPSGQSATVRFHLGSAFAGKTVSIFLSSKGASGSWSVYRHLTVRRVEANGYAYVFVKGAADLSA